MVCGLVAVGHTAVPVGHAGWWWLAAVGHTAAQVGDTEWCVGWLH